MLRRFRLNSFFGAQRYTLTVPSDWPACNPSIANDGEGFRVIVRTVNYRLRENGHWLRHPPGGARTVNWLLRLDRDLKTMSTARIADQSLIVSEPRAKNGLEDGRPFYWRNDWWFAAAAVRFADESTVPTMCFCQLDEDNRVVDAHFIDSPLQQKKEKNWMPVVDGDALRVIYRISPLQIIDIADGWQSSLHASVGRHRAIDDWAGSSQLVEYRGNWLCIVHKRFERRNYVYYQHAFVELSSDFRILRVSRPWFFDASTVEFCAGLCLSGDSAILSYGYMDREARLLKLPLQIVEDLLEDTWRSWFRLIGRRGEKN
jgi:hypothetical protein